jgi:branched-chain amino acid transport system ATP-binding protein
VLQVSEQERAAISCRAVSKRFAGVVALENVSLEIGAGEIAALIGPNGAGKTTLFNCITGALHPDSGEIWLGEQRIERRRSVSIARLGLARTFQNLRMFAGLSAYESVLAAAGRRQLLARRGSSPSSRFGFPSSPRGRALAALEAVGLRDRADVDVSKLGLVEQRRLEIGRALALEPRVLLLDEPAAGTTPREALELVALIRRLNTETGLTVLLIEHTMAFVMECAAIVHVLYFGRLMRSGTPDEIVADTEVRNAYLGARIGKSNATREAVAR